MSVVSGTPSPTSGRKTLLPDQLYAVERLARHLRRPGTRALFVSATGTGTGKTLVSIRVADELDARLVLFVVPILDLAVQTALAWRAGGHGEHMVIVSSLDTNAREDLVAARVMSTTSPHVLGGLMSVVGEEADQIRALTVICTYDSLIHHHHARRPDSRPPRARLDRRTRRARHDLGQARRRLARPPRRRRLPPHQR